MTTPNINTVLRKNPRPARYGAPLGSRNHTDATSKLHLQRVHFVDGDYGADGTYWGAGSGPDDRLWCAFNGPNDPQYDTATGTRVYVRARTRAKARAEILDLHPELEFLR